MGRGWVRPVALALGLVVGLAGCAAIPDGGRVHTVDEPVTDDQGTVRYAPVGPTEGASPDAVVQGFLDAMLAFPASSAVASSFLTRDAARDWRVGAGTRIYSRHEVTAVAPSGRPGRTEGSAEVRVRLQGTVTATLGPTGRFRPDGRLDETVTLRRERGEWRITDPPDGMLVTERWFEDYVRPFDVYFFDRTGERLVPDVVHLPLGDQLPTSLLSALAAGPDDDTLQRTYLPASRSLRPSVPVGSDDVADVQFGAQLDGLPTDDSDRLGAQVAATLAQVEGLRGVRINGGAVTSSDGQPIIALTDGDRFGPGPASSAAYAVVADRLRRLDADRLRPVAGPLGRSTGSVTALAVGARQAAVVRSGAVTIAPLSDEGRSRKVPVAGRTAISWDVTGRLWIADAPGDRTRIRTWNDGEVRDVPVAGLGDVRVRSVALSPDGGRLAVTGRGRTAVGDTRRLDLPVRSVRDAGWFDTSTLELLGSSPLGVQVRRVQIDGSGLTDGVGGGGALLPDLDALALVRGPSTDPPRWVTDRERRLWYQSPGRGWVRIATGITALSGAP